MSTLWGATSYAPGVVAASAEKKSRASADTTAETAPVAGSRSNERAPGRRDTSRARELFRLGTNAYRSGRIEEARELLGEAWELQHSYDVAATLGQVEFELGHVVRANELLDFCLQNFPPIESDEKLAKMKRVREKARSRVAVLEIDCACDGAHLRVDDDDVGTLPLTHPLYVLPGRRILRCCSNYSCSLLTLAIR
ncbi:MAG: hypothetical protein QM784_36200, partial [Polyangiaceae bacterium]